MQEIEIENTRGWSWGSNRNTRPYLIFIFKRKKSVSFDLAHTAITINRVQEAVCQELVALELFSFSLD